MLKSLDASSPIGPNNLPGQDATQVSVTYATSLHFVPRIRISESITTYRIWQAIAGPASGVNVLFERGLRLFLFFLAGVLCRGFLIFLPRALAGVKRWEGSRQTLPLALLRRAVLDSAAAERSGPLLDKGPLGRLPGSKKQLMLQPNRLNFRSK
jgi:hypothetical protein